MKPEALRNAWPDGSIHWRPGRPHGDAPSRVEPYQDTVGTDARAKGRLRGGGASPASKKRPTVSYGPGPGRTETGPMSDRPTDMRYAGIVAGKLPNGGDAGVGVALPTHSLPLSIGKGSCNRYRYRIPRQFCPKLGQGNGRS